MNWHRSIMYTYIKCSVGAFKALILSSSECGAWNGHKFGWFYLMKSENEVKWNQKSLSEKILKFWWCANFYAAHQNDPFKYDCKRQLNQ